MGQVVHGDLDGISQHAQGLQGVSDTQAGLMDSLGSTLEALGSALKGSAGMAIQNVGEQLIQQGHRFSTHFADHSHKMANNRQILESSDHDGAGIINQVGNLITNV